MVCPGLIQRSRFSSRSILCHPTVLICWINPSLEAWPVLRQPRSLCQTTPSLQPCSIALCRGNRCHRAIVDSTTNQQALAYVDGRQNGAQLAWTLACWVIGRSSRLKGACLYRCCTSCSLSVLVAVRKPSRSLVKLERARWRWAEVSKMRCWYANTQTPDTANPPSSPRTMPMMMMMMKRRRSWLLIALSLDSPNSMDDSAQDGFSDFCCC